jgi:hypothetical protein
MSPMNARLLRPTASGKFDPRSIANIFYWLDATDTSSLRTNSDGTGSVTASGDLVGNWQNIAGTSGVTTSQATTNNRPQYQAAGINGKPALLFNAASATTQFDQTFPNLLDHTICCAVKADQINNVRGLIGGVGVPRSYSLQIRFSNWYGSPGANPVDSGIAASTSPVVIIWAQDATVSNLRVNSASASLAYGRSGSASTTQIIGQSAFSEFWNGYIGEIIRYSRVLSQAEQDAVRLYLGKKWGIATT